MKAYGGVQVWLHSFASAYDELHIQAASDLLLIEYDAGWERKLCYLSADFRWWTIFNYTYWIFTVTDMQPRWLIRYSDSLRAGRSVDRISVGARFSAPVLTDPGANPASYIIGIGSFMWVKRPRRGVDHPLPSSAEVKERVELNLCYLSGPSWPVLGCLYL